MPEHAARAVSWPTAASAVVEVAAGRAPVSVGGLPVSVAPVVSQDGFSGRGVTTLPAPAQVSVQVLDRDTAQRSGAAVALRLARADGGVGDAQVRLSADISGFRDAFGGAFAARMWLRLVPECGLTPVTREQAQRGACAGVDVDSTVDFRAGIVSADIDLNTVLADLSAPMSAKQQALLGVEADPQALSGGGGMVVLLTSGSQADGVGTFGKTGLSETATWSHSGASGNFTYGYPLDVPPVPGDLVPDLSVDYSSATVDGQTAAQHLQNGPLGEGWSLNGAGFIESTLRPCRLDYDHSPTWTNATDDPCFRHENFQLSWSGQTSELVPTSTANLWRIADDDAAKVEYLPAATPSPHWRVTTVDGTQYYFGRQQLPGWTSGGRETGSVLSHEMFANHSGEPCFSASSYTASHCAKPYRWLLDYVLDVHGNSMSYWYTRHANLSGSNNSGQTTYSYHRDATLDRIEYGTRAGNETTATAPAVVEFTNSDRCLSSCGTEAAPNTANWFDTPFDLRCTAAPCNGNLAPSYWTTKRLTKVTSKVWTGSATTYKTVDEWAFGQSFPGGTDVPTLWLDSITRTGYDATGASITMPALTTHGRIDRNRADYDPNASMADPQKYRIDYIDTESGSRVEVSYLPANESACTWWSGKLESQWPNYNDNPSRCFQQWVKNRSGVEGWSWWHKFVVDKITENDLVSDAPDVVTSYQYTMDGATSNRPLVLWGYSNSVWASPKKAMSSWKGYPTLITTVGAPGQTQSVTRQLYYRGLDRDTGLNTGQEFFRTAAVVDSLGGSVVDHQALGGRLREEIVYDGPAEISKTIHTVSAWQTAGGTLPTWQTPPERIAYMVRDQSAAEHTRLIIDKQWSSVGFSGNLANHLADVNGDGKADLVAQNGNAAYVMLSTGSSFGPGSQWSSAGFSGNLANHIGDVNGDGKADLVAQNYNSAFVMLSTGSSFAPGTQWSSASFSGNLTNLLKDVNGDGKADLVAQNGNAAYVMLSTGSAFGPGSQWSSAGFSGNLANHIVDVTGDGKADLVAQNASNAFVAPSTGSSFGPVAQWSSAAFSGAAANLIGDVSGDGKADPVAQNIGNSSVMLSTGSAFGAPTAWSAMSFIGTLANLIGDVSGDGKADLVALDGARSRVLLSTGEFGQPTWRTRTIAYGWNTTYGTLDTAEDQGNSALSGDETCTRQWYVHNTTSWIIGALSRTETVGVGCAATPAYPTDLLDDERTSYDGLAYGVAPTRGLPTRTETVKSHNGTTPTGFVVTESGYDQWGRPLWDKDPLGNQTDYTYTHDSAGLLQSDTETSPPPVAAAARHTTTTTYDVLRGLPLNVTDPNSKVTTGTYDPLGRLQTVRQPGNTGTNPDVEYGYSLTKTGVPWVHAKALGPNGNQISSYDIYDGLLRPRQTQNTAPDGNRTITDTHHDSRGLIVKESVYYNASVPTSSLDSAADTAIERQQRYSHDGAERQTHQQLWKNNVKQFETITDYLGDRVGVVPPAGGTPTQVIYDARGRLTEKRQFSGLPFTGAFDKTLYTYDGANRLTTVKDPANNTWTYKYDLLGREYERIDPDSGTSKTVYDDADQITSSEDGRGQKLFYEYDNLGRRLKRRADTAAGTILASWTYDTVAKGTLTSTSRFDGADTYTTAVDSYDDGYRPLSTTETIPGFGTGGATLTYTVTNTYKANGAPHTVAVPSVGGLPAETLTSTYTDQGMPDTVTSGQATYLADTIHAYDGAVLEQRLGAAGKQVKLTNQYDAATRRLQMQSLFTESPTTPGTFGTAKYDNDYTYDPAGNITNTGTLTNGVRDQAECLRYDYLRRLTEAWTQTTTTCATPQRTGTDPYWRQWTFDSVGSRLTQTDKNGAGDSSWTYQVGSAGAVKPHQVKQVTSTGPLASPIRTFSYDPAGNTLTRTTDTGAGQTLAWDKEGHLATLAEAGVTTTYVYDTTGRRLISATPTKKTLYLPDGTELEKLGTANPLGRRNYGVAVRDASGLKWIFTNHQQSSTVQVDSTTLASVRRRFMPYGELRGTQPAGWVGTNTFVTGTKDDTGLIHLGAREYDQSLGRFISIDPIFNLADPQSWHGYSYAANTPVTLSDPSGLENLPYDFPGTGNSSQGPGNGGDRTSGSPNGSWLQAGKVPGTPRILVRRTPKMQSGGASTSGGPSKFKNARLREMEGRELEDPKAPGATQPVNPTTQPARPVKPPQMRTSPPAAKTPNPKGGSATAKSGASQEATISQKTGLPRNTGPNQDRLVDPKGKATKPDFRIEESIKQRGTILESKDVAKLEFRGQLRSMMASARSMGVPLEIVVRPTTIIPNSGGLARAIARGWIRITRLDRL
ncbi:FG-GAP-like repeat-containing protein [Rhizocola hellebori]|nr:FG-GAP-like repeat-containing protein [Rhizocola hellebori]